MLRRWHKLKFLLMLMWRFLLEHLIQLIRLTVVLGLWFRFEWDGGGSEKFLRILTE